MILFDIVYRSIRLRVECTNRDMESIIEHLNSYAHFEDCRGIPRFTLVIENTTCKKTGVYVKFVDKWFDNACADCYFDLYHSICFMDDIQASSNQNRKLLIQYFTANLLNRFLEIEGYIGIHSSCVEKNQKGALFVGGRNSGKTVCMLNMMHYGYNCVTNDKSALNSSVDGVTVYGIAQSISIRMDKSFRSQKCNRKYVEYSIKKGLEFEDSNKLEGNNVVMSPKELTLLNHVKVVPETNLRLIVSPKYSPSIRKLSVQNMSFVELKELLAEQDMSLVHETTSFFRLIEPHVKRNYNLPNVLCEIKKLPAILCGQNEYTLEDFFETIDKLVL